MTWNGIQVVLKKSERTLDGTPFKAPVAAINAIIEIANVRRRSTASQPTFLMISLGRQR
jgi:hypothetical protein